MKRTFKVYGTLRNGSTILLEYAEGSHRKIMTDSARNGFTFMLKHSIDHMVFARDGKEQRVLTITENI